MRVAGRTFAFDGALVTDGHTLSASSAPLLLFSPREWIVRQTKPYSLWISQSEPILFVLNTLPVSFRRADDGRSR